jgi:hypothetical protein
MCSLLLLDGGPDRGGSTAPLEQLDELPVDGDECTASVVQVSHRVIVPAAARTR